MSLSVRQKVTLYSILEVPYSTSINRIVDNDNLLATTYTPDTNLTCAIKIEQRLVEIESVADLETDLIYCLDRWYDLFGDSTEMVAGSTGGNSGISFNLNNERMQLRARVLAMVPFTRDYMSEELSKVTKDRISINLIR